MEQSSFTLYKIEGFDNSSYIISGPPKISKINNVKTITNAYDNKQNKTIYAIVGEELKPLPLGAVRKENFKNNVIYTIPRANGTSIYATNKKIMYKFFLMKCKDKIKRIEKHLKQQKELMKYYEEINDYDAFKQYIISFEKQIIHDNECIKNTYEIYKSILKQLKNL